MLLQQQGGRPTKPLIFQEHQLPPAGSRAGGAPLAAEGQRGLRQKHRGLSGQL